MTGKKDVKKVITIHVPGSMKARLDDEKERTGAPVSEIVRRALNEYLTGREGPAVA